jgi:hypothetical protein
VGDDERQPIIGNSSWGRIEVEELGQFRDVKLWPGGAREWDWSETGTRHVPGVQPADVEDLLTTQPDTVVLSTGRQQRLMVRDDTLQLLNESKISVVREETSIAIAEYNRIARSGRRVVALIHSTC